MLDFVASGQDLQANIDYLERTISSNRRKYRDLIKLGTCFVAYKAGNETHFAPSRFLGYRDNSFEEHERNDRKDGRETNPAITTIIGSPPKPDEELEKSYRDFCVGLGFDARPRGNFGVERKYWDWR